MKADPHCCRCNGAGWLWWFEVSDDRVIDRDDGKFTCDCVRERVDQKIMKVDVQLQTETYVIRERDPEDEWDIGHYGVRMQRCHVMRTASDSGWEFSCEVGDSVVVLIEHYEDGCTFGFNQYMEVKGVFYTRADAEDYASSIEIDHGYFGRHLEFLYEVREVMDVWRHVFLLR